MKPLSAYNINVEDFIQYNSKLCSVACSLGKVTQFSPLDNRINELVNSFFNQWQFIITTYGKLDELLNELNQHSDTHSGAGVFSKYDIESSIREIDFKSYSYLLIISLKTYLDLFASIVDIIQNQIIREEYNTPDFNKVGKSNGASGNSEITEEFNKLRDKNNYPWINLLTEVRNRIVHRGYHLKPKFGFKKSDELVLQTYKGVDHYTDTLSIEIGKLFNDFMADMPVIEERISSILIKETTELNKKLSVKASFKFGGLIAHYSFEESDDL